jgi:hypothetical protein
MNARTSLFSELKRRNVLRAGVLYAGAVWALAYARLATAPAATATDKASIGVRGTSTCTATNPRTSLPNRCCQYMYCA